MTGEEAEGRLNGTLPLVHALFWENVPQSPHNFHMTFHVASRGRPLVFDIVDSYVACTS